jgi:hypothetical protein
MMHADVHDEQTLLLGALLGGVSETVMMNELASVTSPAWRSRGWSAYRANASALAERALSAAYPVLVQMLGTENFTPMARHYWQQSPPRYGDISRWGDGLADFIEAALQLMEEPFLADVARVEWALHRAASSADVEPDARSFELIASLGPERTTLRMGTGLAFVASPWPVASLVNSHLSGNPPIEDAAIRCARRQGEHAVVWREGYRPRVRAMDTGEHALMAALLAGASLEAALGNALSVSPEFNFQHWLADAFRTHLVTGAQALNSAQISGENYP